MAYRSRLKLTLAVLVGAASLLGAAGMGGCSAPAPPSAAADAAPTAAVRASNGDIVSAEAEAVPIRDSDLSFKVLGRVTEVQVSEGQAVKAGQELAQLDQRDLVQAVRQAEARLRTAQAQVAKLKAGPRPEEVAVAQAAVSIAEANVKAAESAVAVAEGSLGTAQAGVNTAAATLARAKEGPTPEQLNIAAAGMAAAEAALKQAQAAYDKIKGMAEVGIMPQSLQLEQATIEYNRARASYQNTANGATPAEIQVYEQQVMQAQAALPTAQAQVAQAQAQVETAKAQLAQAQAQLAAVQAGSSKEDIAIAEAGALEAEAALAEAQNALADGTLKAPFDGTLGSVAINPGQIASPQFTAMTIGDLSRLQLRTKDLSEADVNQVKVGQSVAITVDALAGKKLTGRVARIAPVASDNRGDTVYTVYVDVDAGPEAGLRWGMTAFVDIKVR